MNNEMITKEKIIALANEGLKKQEIAFKFGYDNYATFYQKMRRVFLQYPEEYTQLKIKLKLNELNVTQEKKNNSPITINTNKNKSPLKLDIHLIKDMVYKEKTVEELMEYFQYENPLDFFIDLRKAYHNNELYNKIYRKIKFNKGIKLLELSNTLTLNDIAALYNMSPKKFVQSIVGNFEKQAMYDQFLDNLGVRKIKLPSEIKEISKPKTTNMSDKDDKDDKNEVKKLDIFHSDYIFNLGIQELQNAFHASHFIIIPQSTIDIMLEDQSSYQEELTIITRHLEKQPQFSDNGLCSHENDYYTKLALLYQRKGYDVTLYCNNPDIMIECLFLNIKVKHNHQYSYQALATSPVSTDIHAYDITYLIEKHENLNTSQPKLICECVLRELLNQHYYDVIYYIVDNNIPKNHFIFLRDEFSSSLTYHKSDFINTMLNTFQYYEIFSGSKIVVKTLDFKFRYEARKLNFKLEELSDQKLIHSAV